MLEKNRWMDWRGCVARCVAPLALGGAALAQGAPAAAADPVESDESATAGFAGLVAHVEYGSHPERFGFKLLLDGGEAFATGVLALEGKGLVRSVYLPIQLDADGHWERVWLDVPLTDSVEARFALTSVAGPSMSTKTSVGSAGGTGISPLQRKAILVREVMKDPTAVSDAKGEWFELVNLTNQSIDLKGWVLDDGGSNHHVIGGTAGNSVWILPGVPFVMGANADSATNGGVTVDYKYSSFSLGNGADVIALYAPSGALVDWVSYDDGIFWPDTAGAALSLRPGILGPSLADDGTLWCDASTPMAGAAGDFGTPGVVNDACP